MYPKIKIGRKIVGEGRPLYLIAEAGVNHENNFETALKMIDEAAAAGVDAIKFQSYKANTISSKNSPAYWDQTKEPTKSQFKLFQKYDSFNSKEYIKLANHALQKKITFLTTCFDSKFVNELNDILPVFKIASADLTNFPLLKLIASKKKPVILSTGASTLAEIHETVAFLKNLKVAEIALLHCVLNYPCTPDNADLISILTLKRNFPDLVIGYSDHVPPQFGMSQLSAAWSLGATLVEKHFTLDKTLPGNDHYHSMDPIDVLDFKKRQFYFEKLMGKNVFENRQEETNAIKYARRSLVAKRKIKKGEKITMSMIEIKRPGTGIAPKHLEMINGAKALRNISDDEVLQWDMFIKY